MGALVSAIMPTQNRRSFISQAIKSYISQDWPEKELIVVDSGSDRVEDLFANVPGAKYIYYREENRPEYLPHTPIGTKRNVACENASGEIIVHWDDDDFSEPKRITDQVMMLKVSGKSVAGYNPIREYSKFTGNVNEYAVPQNMACGTSLCYRRDYWKEHKFKNTSFGEDWMFTEEALELGELITADGRKYMMSTAHPGNTCKRG
jgi:glycosyltransferase involved in cell wall biosynthesis